MHVEPPQPWSCQRRQANPSPSHVTDQWSVCEETSFEPLHTLRTLGEPSPYPPSPSPSPCNMSTHQFHTPNCPIQRTKPLYSYLAHPNLAITWCNFWVWISSFEQWSFHFKVVLLPIVVGLDHPNTWPLHGFLFDKKLKERPCGILW